MIDTAALPRYRGYCLDTAIVPRYRGTGSVPRLLPRYRGYWPGTAVTASIPRYCLDTAVLPRYRGTASIPRCCLDITVLSRYHGTASIPRYCLDIVVLPRYLDTTSIPRCYLDTAVLPRYRGTASIPRYYLDTAVLPRYRGIARDGKTGQKAHLPVGSTPTRPHVFSFYGNADGKAPFTAYLVRPRNTSPCVLSCLSREILNKKLPPSLLPCHGSIPRYCSGRQNTKTVHLLVNKKAPPPYIQQ